MKKIIDTGEYFKRGLEDVHLTLVFTCALSALGRVPSFDYGCGHGGR